MNSMKTLAYMETRKLTRFLDAQHAVVASIQEVAVDFLSFHADTLPEAGETTTVCLLIGTERGFCGDFNQALLRHLELVMDTQSASKSMLIAVGRKLCAMLEDDARVKARIAGVSVVEEVTVVLGQIVEELSILQAQHGMLTVYGLYHSGDAGVVTHRLLPPFQRLLQEPRRNSHPPLLNLSPGRFLVELTEHYLFAALNTLLYTSLMAENRDRVAHLERATRHLDDELNELARQCQALRQEEIIEEIEVILLSARSLEESSRERQ